MARSASEHHPLGSGDCPATPLICLDPGWPRSRLCDLPLTQSPSVPYEHHLLGSLLPKEFRNQN
jgi:hypothetical protein